MAATGPLQLEQVTAELTGAEIYKALHEGGEALWFDWWFEELVRAAGDRVKAESTADGNAWQVPWRLLHGLAAIGSPALSALAVQTPKEAARAFASTQPDWLSLCPDGAVTGQVWTVFDSVDLAAGQGRCGADGAPGTGHRLCPAGLPGALRCVARWHVPRR